MFNNTCSACISLPVNIIRKQTPQYRNYSTCNLLVEFYLFFFSRCWLTAIEHAYCDRLCNRNNNMLLFFCCNFAIRNYTFSILNWGFSELYTNIFLRRSVNAVRYLCARMCLLNKTTSVAWVMECVVECQAQQVNDVTQIMGWARLVLGSNAILET